MPRQRRKLYDEASYHIINRGHNKSFIFKEPQDYEQFKSIIHNYKKKYCFELFHYCIMGNHFHLIIRIKHGHELPLVMKCITQSYVNYYKRKYHFTGILFQNRYKSFPIEKEEYLLECARYVERNPLRAKIVQNIRKYAWSSYKYYAIGFIDDIIDTNPLYDTFGNREGERHKRYQSYVGQDRPYENLLDKVIMK